MRCVSVVRMTNRSNVARFILWDTSIGSLCEEPTLVSLWISGSRRTTSSWWFSLGQGCPTFLFGQMDNFWRGCGSDYPIALTPPLALCTLYWSAGPDGCHHRRPGPKVIKIKYINGDGGTAECVGYIVNNDDRENTYERHENWPKFWAVIWMTFCPCFGTKFCLCCRDYCGRNRCQRLFWCSSWIADRWQIWQQ